MGHSEPWSPSDGRRELAGEGEGDDGYPGEVLGAHDGLALDVGLDEEPGW